ncbi:M48 family metalloprotease [Ectothiorhodospira shaposhnikovii]|uniref:M48 family metalloprotease n=1 Tax=Ectothiorhodospira shaposhnikovii TaxID=1054 RepID=UPI001EE96D31|nr:M48 family metalloprotease [Ectothiorhodospira shaposhnikovii]MCG5514082.1 M48 family metalloprotease [Ectothiorhodospira shaposhnikovii]
MDHNPGHRIFRRRMTRRDFLWLMSASTAGAVVLPSLKGCAVDPVTGQQRLMLMSEQEEIAVDRQHSPHQFSNDYGLLRDNRVNNYVTQVGNSVAEVSHRPHMPYSFNVVNANYINAYTFPGGTMACTRGIMVEMEDEAALAALLGHETGHVNARHTARRQTTGIIAAVVLGGVGIAAAQSERLSGYSNLIYAVSAVGATALLAHYSRENEREADALGLEYMSRAGQNPQGMVDLMDMLRGMSDRQPNALETMFSTHPMSQERFDTAQREASSRYSADLNRNVGRERYMDNTASLRRIKPAIKEQQAGEARMARNQYAQAERHFATSLRQAPDDYPGLLLMSKAKTAQGQHREAERYLQQARSAYPDEGQAIHLSGINQLAQNRPDVALSHFQRYERILPGNPNTVFLQGVAHENMQNRQAAAQQYQRYIQMAGTQTEQGRYAAQRLQSWR